MQAGTTTDSVPTGVCYGWHLSFFLSEEQRQWQWHGEIKGGLSLVLGCCFSIITAQPLVRPVLGRVRVLVHGSSSSSSSSSAPCSSSCMTLVHVGTKAGGPVWWLARWRPQRPAAYITVCKRANPPPAKQHEPLIGAGRCCKYTCIPLRHRPLSDEDAGLDTASGCMRRHVVGCIQPTAVREKGIHGRLSKPHLGPSHWRHPHHG